MISPATNSCHTTFISVSYRILPVLNTLSALVAVLGNFAVLYAIYSTPKLRTLSNYFLCSLSAADFLVGLAMDPIYVAVFVLEVQDDTHPLRVAEHWLWIQTVVSTTFTLCAVTVERYIAVTFVFKYIHIVTVTRCSCCVAFIWIFSFLFASVRLFISDPAELPKLWTVTTVLGILLPLAIILYCNLQMVREAQHQVRQIVAQSRTNPALATVMAKNKKAAYTVGIVVLLFVLLWSPSLVLSFVELSTGNPCVRRYITYVWFWAAFVSFLSSSLNPFVYSVRCRDIRGALIRVLRISRVLKIKQ